MDGYEYERLVARYLRSHGYNGVKVTQASGDMQKKTVKQLSSRQKAENKKSSAV